MIGDLKPCRICPAVTCSEFTGSPCPFDVKEEEMSKKVVEVLDEMRRLKLLSDFEIGDYEEEFAGDGAWLWVRCFTTWYKIHIDKLLKIMKALPTDHGKIIDVETSLLPFAIESKPHV